MRTAPAFGFCRLAFEACATHCLILRCQVSCKVNTQKLSRLPSVLCGGTVTATGVPPSDTHFSPVCSTALTLEAVFLIFTNSGSPQPAGFGTLMNTSLCNSATSYCPRQAAPDSRGLDACPQGLPRKTTTSVFFRGVLCRSTGTPAREKQQTHITGLCKDRPATTLTLTPAPARGLTHRSLSQIHRDKSSPLPEPANRQGE